MSHLRRAPESLVPALLVLGTALFGLEVSSYLQGYFLDTLVKSLATSPAGRVMPVMAVERGRHPELDEAYRSVLAERRARTRQMLRRAVERGDLPSDTDVEVMSTMLVGPIFHRFLITREPLDDAFVDALVDALLRGFGATA